MFSPQKLKESRERKGLTKSALAKKSKVSHSVIHYLETGITTNPGINNLSKIARALEVAVDDFIEEV